MTSLRKSEVPNVKAGAAVVVAAAAGWLLPNENAGVAAAGAEAGTAVPNAEV